MASKATKVSDPNAKGSSGFLWAVGVLLVIVAVVIGFIVWKGQGAKTEALGDMPTEETSMNMEYDDNAVVLKAADAKKDATEVELYEDYSCPHCGDLAIASDGDMKTAIEEGKLIVHVRTLNFLDGRDIEGNTGHSTKAAAAMEQIAKAGDVKTYWNLRKYLMENQQEVANQWSFEDFADAAKQLGADDSLVDSIKNVDIKNGNKLAKFNYDKLEKDTGSVSSPRIIKDGKDFPEEGSGKSIMEWVSLITA
ncbi:DsbA family protein [Corynebacterium striatum]|uniref:DsbA family protein n=1 Tax=Corynebacterium striatum TaxID=43770 RepID=UPI000C1CC3B0|nr:thioredoxin domain-containing protein [Corynebacterium striatum]MBD0856572.1 hypothetical protein [Corynebacterium striatum]PIS59100.1 hypothetical protein AZH45_02730 [Corynebacterium striatum]PIS63954.1 hypothetical protein AZH44_07025 [Corynebacterium striatum]PIS67488.1 hypothetical protein AZH46_02715 [Corynebacterium striatum]PXY07325.1 hypothetical protein CKF53_02880 [Corynebacterium striatum]